MILFVLEALTALVLVLLLIWWTVAGARKHDDPEHDGTQRTKAQNDERQREGP